MCDESAVVPSYSTSDDSLHKLSVDQRSSLLTALVKQRLGETKDRGFAVGDDLLGVCGVFLPIAECLDGDTLDDMSARRVASESFSADELIEHAREVMAMYWQQPG